MYSSFAVAAWRAVPGIGLVKADDDLAVSGLGLMVGGIIFGWFWDRWHRRTAVICAGLAITVISVVEVALGPSGVWPVLSALSFGLVGSGVPSLLTAEASVRTAARSLEIANGLAPLGIITIPFAVAAGISPEIGGNLTGPRDSFADAFWVAAAIVVVGAAILLAAGPSPRVADATTFSQTSHSQNEDLL